MPSQLPSSFASAAAGQSNRDSRSVRDGRGGGSGEWSRRDGRSTNGTMTFRRSSTTPSNNQSTSQPLPPADGPAPQSQTPAADVVPFDGTLRYTKEQLLEIYKLSDTGVGACIESLYVAGWNPAPVNGNTVRNWGKGNEAHVPQDPSVCWEANGTVKPIGLQEMSAEEKELFNSDVNSPIKPPQQNKDGVHQTGGLNGRKASVSHGSTFATSSPSTASRPGTRRRETGDASPFPADGLVSPTGASRFARGDSSSWFGRRSLEEKDDTFDEPPEDNNREAAPTTRPTGFGALTRSNTTGTSASGSTGFAAASSLWGTSAAQATAASPMGSFGNFSMSASSAIGDKRFPGARESRLAHLIPKDSNNAASEGSSTPKGNEGSGAEATRSWRPRPRTDTDPFGEDGGTLGSLREGTSPSPQQQVGGQRGNIFETPVKGSAGDFGMSGLNLGTHKEEEATPETNPYRSPPAERNEDDTGAGNFGGSQAHGQGLDQQSGFGAIARGFPASNIEGSAGDRSQTSSVGGNKGFHNINTLTGWPSGMSSGTPDRDRSAFPNPFGNSIFSPDIQSPSGLSGLGNVFGPAGAGGSLRGSKLGSLFPAAMQAQMQVPEHDSHTDPVPDYRQVNPLGAIGRSATGPQLRDTDSPMRSGRSGVFEELFPTSDATRAQGLFSTAEPASGLTSTTQGQSFAATTTAQSFPGIHAQSDTPPSQSQTRTMVMPDRMRWVYLDPQGNTQGPFTGLEMNDWYKANFFTPDLRVKRIEDDDFEPLGQLIRRIGNSREPFLVPQIGVAHGPPPQAGPFSTGDSRGVIPPLVGAFPSFGRTLTAEEQNNLERRKQEEQFLMHRQREFMAQQQQAFTKMAMQTGVPGVLHHHSSAHSLQSQPSFGSITSPIGMPPQAAIGGALGAATAGPSYFDATSQGLAQPGLPTAPSDLFQNDLNLQERQMLASLQGGAGALGGASALSGILPPQRPSAAIAAPGPSGNSLDANMHSQLPSVDQLQQDPQGFSARLKEFQEIRAQRDAEATTQASAAAAAPNVPVESNKDITARGLAQQDAAQVIEEVTKAQEVNKKAASQPSTLSLTQQVQKTQAAAAKQAPSHESGALMPFPPPAGAPLAAPTAQRTRSTLPDQFAVSRSQSGTPESLSATQAAPPPLAPWARAEAEQQKGPNFKEIQEAEAKKAARAELAAAAARRAVLEQEAALAREREKTAVSGAAPILPMSSTWGNGSPVTPSTATSPWAKPAGNGPKGANQAPAAGGPAASALNAEKKKTLAEIQREEEARKQRLAKAQEQAAAANNAVASTVSGKRYADLASKVGQAGGSAAASMAAGPPGAGWATVGAGGKVKIPTGPSAAQAGRIAGPGNAKPPASSQVAKPAASRPAVAAANKADTVGAAMEEFNKWLRRELSRGITGGIDIDSFASTLLVLPLDQTLISDAVYANSTTMDGRHFAEEFIRRKKLADKGVIEKQPVGGRGAGGAGASSAGNSDNKGWNEVAKKSSSGAGNNNSNGAGEGIQGAGFKVVPGRKRGKK